MAWDHMLIARILYILYFARTPAGFVGSLIIEIGFSSVVINFLRKTHDFPVLFKCSIASLVLVFPLNESPNTRQFLE